MAAVTGAGAVRFDAISARMQSADDAFASEVKVIAGLRLGPE